MSTGAEQLRSNYKKLVTLSEELSHLHSINSLLGWDQQVMMPSKASGARAKQLGVFAGLEHNLKTSKELGQVLEQLRPVISDPTVHFTEWEKAVIRDAARDYDRETKIPKELATRIAQLSSEGYDTWVVARKENNFNKFSPILKEWVQIARETAKLIDPSKPAYDVLLDQYERGMSSATIDKLFAQLKEKLVPLILSITQKAKPDDSFLQHKFDVATQAKMNHELAKKLGFDTDSGRLDVSVHPFTCDIHPTDVRMTTRYKESDIIEGISGTMHETGHSLYEQGRCMEYADLPVSRALSMGIHESQSLFWERMVGLSLPFWTFYWPTVKTFFSQIPADAPVDKMYKLVNKVEPGFIRVEADEVTYPMHIILRYEIEKGLVEGTVEVDDLPKLWNQKMKEYLGIEPKTDTEGVLQDTHWSCGLFGYFPTYTLGAIYASQFFKKMNTEMPVEEHMTQGNFTPIREWLNKNIHMLGSLLPGGNLLTERVTGEPLNPDIFVEYLTKKYSALYNL